MAAGGRNLPRLTAIDRRKYEALAGDVLYATEHG